MNDIHALDLKTIVGTAVKTVFETMVSAEVQLLDTDVQLPTDDKKIAGSVSFTGDVIGGIHIYLSDNLARIITAGMLGVELDEIDGEEDVHDVIGEFSNMIGGDLKSRLCDAGLPCVLSIPSITSGTDFVIESKGWTRHEKIAFSLQTHIALVEVTMKAGD